MILFKVVEFLILVVYCVALAGAYAVHKDTKKQLDGLELSIIGVVCTSAALHLINLFR